MRSQKGFTLIEIMIAVSIIGILAALAIPQFKSMTARAHQVEAKAGLSAIHTLEVAYWADRQRYGSISQIGFVAEGAGRYTFCVGDPAEGGTCVTAAIDPVGVGAISGAQNASSGSSAPSDDECDGGSVDDAGSDPIGNVMSGGAGGGEECGGSRSGDRDSSDDDDAASGGVAIGNPHYSSASFEADAYGHISGTGGDVDAWLVDDKNQLVNFVRGY